MTVSKWSINTIMLTPSVIARMAKPTAELHLRLQNPIFLAIF